MRWLEFTKREKSGILLLCAITIVIAVVVRVSVRTANSKINTTLTAPDTLNSPKIDTLIKIDKKELENLILYNF